MPADYYLIILLLRSWGSLRLPRRPSFRNLPHRHNLRGWLTDSSIRLFIASSKVTLDTVQLSITLGPVSTDFLTDNANWTAAASEIETIVQATIATYSGASISSENVVVTLTTVDTTIVADVVITVPEGVEASSVVSGLSASIDNGSMSAALLAGLNEISFLTSIALGDLTVAISTPEITTPEVRMLHFFDF